MNRFGKLSMKLLIPGLGGWVTKKLLVKEECSSQPLQTNEAAKRIPSFLH
jgi:hypothetical protein